MQPQLAPNFTHGHHLNGKTLPNRLNFMGNTELVRSLQRSQGVIRIL